MSHFEKGVYEVTLIDFWRKINTFVEQSKGSLVYIVPYRCL